MFACLWLLGCAARAPVPAPSPAPPVVPPAQHAGAFSLDTGAWAAPGPGADCAPGQGLLLEVELGAVRLDGGVVLPLLDGVAPAGAAAGVQAALAPWVDAASMRRVRCAEPGPPTLGLALHPDLPWATARAVLMGVGMAGVSRQALIVAGPAGAPLPAGEPPELHVQVTATLGATDAAWSRPQAGRSDPLTGPLAAALPQLTDGGALGCAVVVGRDGLRVGRVVAEMDRLAAVGAVRFIWADDPGAPGLPASPVASPNAEPRAARPPHTGASAAFLLELPRIEPTPAGAELHAGSECSPVHFADRAVAP